MNAYRNYVSCQLACYWPALNRDNQTKAPRTRRSTSAAQGHGLPRRVLEGLTRPKRTKASIVAFSTTSLELQAERHMDPESETRDNVGSEVWGQSWIQALSCMVVNRILLFVDIKLNAVSTFGKWGSYACSKPWASLSEGWKWSVDGPVRGRASTVAACAADRAITSSGSRLRTLCSSPCVRIGRFRVSGRIRVCRARLQSWVDERFEARLDAPETIPEPLGNAGRGAVIFSCPSDRIRGRRRRRRRGIVDCGVGIGRMVPLALEVGRKMGWIWGRDYRVVCESNPTVAILRSKGIVNNVGIFRGRRGSGGYLSLTLRYMVSKSKMLRYRVRDIVANLVIATVWEQSSWNFLGKALVTIIWITDWHLQNSLPKSLEFLLGICLNEKRHPSLKANRRQSRYAGSRIVFLLHKMMLAFEVAIHSWDRQMLAIEHGYMTRLTGRSSFCGELEIYTRPWIYLFR